MLKMIFSFYLCLTLFVMIAVAIGLFFTAITDNDFKCSVYGAALDLFSCMLAFRNNTQYVQVSFVLSLAIIATLICFAYVFRKTKSSKIQN